MTGFFHLALCFEGLLTQHTSILHLLYGWKISQHTFFSAYSPVDGHLLLLFFGGYGGFCWIPARTRLLWGMTVTLSLTKFSKILPSPLFSEALTMTTFLPVLERWVWEKFPWNWLSKHVSILHAHWVPHSRILICKASNVPLVRTLLSSAVRILLWYVWVLVYSSFCLLSVLQGSCFVRSWDTPLLRSWHLSQWSWIKSALLF